MKKKDIYTILYVINIILFFSSIILMVIGCNHVVASILMLMAMCMIMVTFTIEMEN